MKIDRPIFIIGTQRSGTTILYRLFTKHKDTAYFEHYCDKLYTHSLLFPLIPYLFRYQKLRYKITRPIPKEGDVWDRFFDPLECLNENHVEEKIKKYYYSAIKSELKAFKATRFVNKEPMNCYRIRWINSMFPDAFYIIIWRDPKAVIYSMYKLLEKARALFNRRGKKYVHGYGPNTLMEKFGKDVSILETYINYYNFLKDQIIKDLPVIKNKLIEINYEDFVETPREIITNLYDFTELKWYPKLNEQIPEVLERNNNNKWKSLPQKEKQILQNAFMNTSVKV